MLKIMEDEMKKNADGDVQIKSPFLTRLDNFWYHYKWHSIAALFAVLVIIIIAVQISSKPSYDIHIMYAGTHSFDRTSSDGDISSR